MATRKPARSRPTPPAPSSKSASSKSAPAVVDTRCARCGRPVHASVVAGALVLVDPGSSEHACPAAGR